MDPVTANANTGAMFNRYNYAYNNPYKFIDPDGRAGCTGSHIKSVCDGGGVAALQTSARPQGEHKALSTGQAIRLNFDQNIDRSILGPGGKDAMHFLGDEIVDGIGNIFDGNLAPAAKNLAVGLFLKKLGPLGTKIQAQMGKRGWSGDMVSDAVNNPVRTVATRDTRHLPGGGRMDDPATAYYHPDGGYVVRNDRTGDVVQVSDRADTGWIAPWD